MYVLYFLEASQYAAWAGEHAEYWSQCRPTHGLCMTYRRVSILVAPGVRAVETLGMGGTRAPTLGGSPHIERGEHTRISVRRTRTDITG